MGALQCQREGQSSSLGCAAHQKVKSASCVFQLRDAIGSSYKTGCYPGCKRGSMSVT